MEKVKVGDRWIGKGEPCFIIAEAGVNHNGDIALARRLIDAAGIAGADAVKFQTFRADRLVTADACKADYQRATTGEGESQYAMLKRLELGDSDFRELSDYARRKNIVFLSTPFDRESADLLDSIDVPAFKISSGDMTDAPLLAHVAGKKKPVILSTGMGTLDEVSAAVNCITRAGNRQIIILHCVTSYPAKIEEANLLAIRTLENVFEYPVGFSDHTPGLLAPVGAVALGACVLEKHITLDKSLPGPDHRASLDPGEFKEMVTQVRAMEKALGTGEKVPNKDEARIKEVARKSIISLKAIARGQVIRADMLTIKRPGTGIDPARFADVCGRKAKIDIKPDVLISWDMIE
jgi:N,N'-diacetyllegionaminate synthase